MRGFATIDNQPGSDTVAVWVTAHVEPHRAGHTNAVCVDKLSNPDASRKLRSLTRDYAVMLTDGSTLDALPIDGKPLSVADIEALVAETEDRQERITAAVAEYAAKTRSKSLAPPTFPPSPVPSDFVPDEDTGQGTSSSQLRGPSMDPSGSPPRSSGVAAPSSRTPTRPRGSCPTTSTTQRSPHFHPTSPLASTPSR